MIIYIASYPRSGNSLVQQLIHDFFGRPTTTLLGRKEAKLARYRDGQIASIRNWCNPPSAATLAAKFIRIYDPLRFCLASYDLTLPSGATIPQKYLMPGNAALFTRRHRKNLAAMDSTFFVKTHGAPYPQFFQGERVILPVRHPGAVLNSLKHFLKDHRGKEVSLDDVIAGRTEHGDWSEWPERWLDACAVVRSQALLLSFEDTVSAPRAACEKISAFLDIPFFASARLQDFESLHKSAPKHFRSGKADEWKGAYDTEQFQLLLKLHEPTLTRIERALEPQSVVFAT